MSQFKQQRPTGRLECRSNVKYKKMSNQVLCPWLFCRHLLNLKIENGNKLLIWKFLKYVVNCWYEQSMVIVRIPFIKHNRQSKPHFQTKQKHDKPWKQWWSHHFQVPGGSIVVPSHPCPQKPSWWTYSLRRPSSPEHTQNIPGTRPQQWLPLCTPSTLLSLARGGLLSAPRPRTVLTPRSRRVNTSGVHVWRTLRSLPPPTVSSDDRFAPPMNAALPGPVMSRAGGDAWPASQVSSRTNRMSQLCP